MTSDELAAAYASLTIYNIIQETGPILFDNDGHDVILKRTKDMNYVNAQYCVQGELRLECILNCINPIEPFREIEGPVVTVTSIERVGGCQKYIDNYGGVLVYDGNPLLLQLVQRHCFE